MHLKHRVLLGTYSVIACASGIFHPIPETSTTTIPFLCKGTVWPRAALLQGFFIYLFIFLTAHSGHAGTLLIRTVKLKIPLGVIQ